MGIMLLLFRSLETNWELRTKQEQLSISPIKSSESPFFLYPKTEFHLPLFYKFIQKNRNLFLFKYLRICADKSRFQVKSCVDSAWLKRYNDKNK